MLMLLAVPIVWFAGWWGVCYLVIGAIAMVLEYTFWWSPLIASGRGQARLLLVSTSIAEDLDLEVLCDYMLDLWRDIVRSRLMRNVAFWPLCWRTLARTGACMTGGQPDTLTSMYWQLEELRSLTENGELMAAIVKRLRSHAGEAVGGL